MRVLIVHHGALPAPGRFCSGGALRAASFVESLRSAGHEVWTLARAQDQKDGFSSARDLQKRASFLAPDMILCVAPEEAPALAPVAPLVVDLYAPRLLEAAWEETAEEEAGRALQAVLAADQVLFSNPRQRWFWMGILGVCGWDLRETAGLLVPLSVPEGPVRQPPSRPLFLVGGKAWPWQDARETLQRATSYLGDRAEVLSVGLPPQAGVTALEALPYDQWLTLCASATAALDRYTPNPERELAMSFRQMDYLGCALPMISSPDGVLAAELRAYQAGWVDETLEDALEQAMNQGRSAGAARLAEQYRPTKTQAPLLAWRPQRREKGPSALRSTAAFAAQRERARREIALREAAEAEVARKREEVGALSRQQQSLVATVEAQAAALADVAGFKREVAQILGNRLSGEQALGEQLRRELEITRSELEKKNMELAAMQAERSRLDRVIARLTPRR